VSWLPGAFLLIASVATGPLGRLGDMFGNRRVLLARLPVLLHALTADIGT
jgi:MFS family permease